MGKGREADLEDKRDRFHVEGGINLTEGSVDYKISLHPSRFLGYQEKSSNLGTVTLYLSKIWECTGDFDSFIIEYIDVMVLERICVERAFQGIRMNRRCKPFTTDPSWLGGTFEFPCKMAYIAASMRFTEWKGE